MRTIHHNAEIIPARYIPAYDEYVYEYSELSEEAKQTALEEWVDSGEPRAMFESSTDESCAAIDHFCREIGLDWSIDGYYNVTLSDTCETEYVRVEDTGFYTSIDLCDIWNKNVYEMLDLYIEYAETEHDTNADQDAAERALREKVSSVLDELGKVATRNIQDEWDYYIYDPANALKNVCDSYGYEFYEDGTVCTDYLNCA